MMRANKIIHLNQSSTSFLYSLELSFKRMNRLTLATALRSRPSVGIIAINSPDFIRAAFACLESGKVAVFLQHDRDEEKIQSAQVTEIIKPSIGSGWSSPTFSPAQTEPDSPAQISFTSGTTGRPKGVVLTCGALNDVVERLNDVMEVDSSIREYIGVPVNYSFGFGRCRAVATAGGAFYLPQQGFNPLEIRDLLQDGAINALSAVPSLWRSLLQCREMFGAETQEVRWIEIGSQYMSRAEKEQLADLFPRAKIAQHYGLTEASRTTFLRIDQVRGEALESVGQAVGRTEVQISPEGKIMIRGPHVAPYLLIDGELRVNTDDQGWHTTNDLGSLKDGYLYYGGRADDQINCGGIKVSPEAFERSLREALGLTAGVAVARVPDLMRGEAILIGSLADLRLPLSTLKPKALAVANQYGINSEEALKFLEFQDFPATDTGKVKRRVMAERYEKFVQEQAQTLEPSIPHPHRVDPGESQTPLTEKELEIVQIWQEVLGTQNIGVDSNFFELGGDSLTALTAMFKMERHGIPKEIIRGILQGLTVREIATRLEGTAENSRQEYSISNNYTHTSLTINIIRGVLVLAVVFGHWSDGFFQTIRPLIGDFHIFLEAIFASFFAAGTPGFSIIYGVTAGYSMFNVYQSDRRRSLRTLYTTAGLLFLGILLMGGVKILAAFLGGKLISLTALTNQFYGILNYFFLITLTLPFWFWLLCQFEFPVFQSFFYALIMYCLYFYLFLPLNELRPEGFLELIKINVSAKYSYFNLTTGTLSGLGIGMILRSLVKKGAKRIPLSFTLAGFSSLAAGFVVASHVGVAHLWLEWPRPIFLWTWLFYIGLILLSLVFVHYLLFSYDNYPSFLKFGLQTLAILGILAFPIYVLQGLVLPLRSILVKTLNTPPVPTAIIIIALFFVIVGLIARKIHSTNFKF